MGPTTDPQPGASFAYLLRAARLKRGLTQEEFAELAKMSVRSVGDLERGRSAPHRSTLERICGALGADGELRSELVAAARSRWAARQEQPAAADVSLNDESPSAPSGDKGPEWRVSVAPRPAQLPYDVSGFRGRAAELAALRRAASSPAPGLWVIDGPGGVGKTALAVRAGHEVAKQFPDGQLYIDLRGMDEQREPVSAAEVLGNFVRALGLDSGRVPTDTDELASAYRTLVADRRILIVLDNASGSAQVRELLPGAAQCLILVTSRTRLSGLAVREGAQRITLTAFDVETSFDLLADLIGPERARREAGTVTRLAERCGRLPLALRIAGEHAKDLESIQDLVGALDDEAARLDVLATDDERTSVRSVFSWSYHTLEPPAAALFRRVGLHPGPEFAALTAAAAADLSLGEASRLLVELASRHLVDRTGADGRYRMHDLMKAFAAEQARNIDTAVDIDRSIRRMLRCYLDTAVVAGRLIAPLRYRAGLDVFAPDQVPPGMTTYRQAVSWFDAEAANLTAAVALAAATGSHDLAWRLAWAMRDYLDLRRPWTAWMTTHTIGLDSAHRAGDRIGIAALLGSLSLAHYYPRHFTEAEDYSRRALEVWREIGDRRGEGTSLNTSGNIRMEQQRFAEAIEYYRHALSIAEDFGDVYSRGVILSNLAAAHCELRRFREARTFAASAADVSRSVGSARSHAFALCHLARAMDAEGEPEKAEAHFREAIRIAQGADDRHVEAWAWNYLGTSAADAGRRRDAASAWRKALALFDELQDSQADSLRRLLAGWHGDGAGAGAE